MSAVFSEIYGCYYAIVARVLAEAENGVTSSRIREIIERYGFAETAYHLMPQLLGDEWKLLERRGDKYYSRLSGAPARRPLTKLEKSWLASLTEDPRLRLFLCDGELEALKNALADTAPLFSADDFAVTDVNLDGDNYTDPHYITVFREVLAACKNGDALIISYKTEKGERSERIYYPYKLCYSTLNDKFRLLCAVGCETDKPRRVTLNLSRIDNAARTAAAGGAFRAKLEKLYSGPYDNPPLVLEISTERNALTRFMLQFAAYERKTRYDAEKNVYVCELNYDIKDETELLILILGFGPTVKVLGPDSFLSQIKSRLSAQLKLLACNKRV